MSATEVAELLGRDNAAVRPFQVRFAEAELTELRRRINATRWPERETVTDHSQGVPLATMQELDPYCRVASGCREHAGPILDQVRAGTMPCDGPWPRARVALFERWIEGGKPG
jgi:hypothetical protein